MFCKYILPLCRLPFHFVDYFAVQNCFNLSFHLLIFLLFFFFASWEDLQVILSHWLMDRLPNGVRYIVIRDHSPLITSENFICPSPDIFPLFSHGAYDLVLWMLHEK